MEPKSFTSPSSGGLLKSIVEAEDKMKKLLSQVDFEKLEMCDEYVIDLGKDFSLYGRSNSLEELKTGLVERGYNTQLSYHQNSEEYQLVISKIKLEPREGRYK